MFTGLLKGFDPLPALPSKACKQHLAVAMKSPELGGAKFHELSFSDKSGHGSRMALFRMLSPPLTSSAEMYG